MREKKQKKNRKIHALLLAFGIGLLGVWNMGEPVAVYGAEESITSMDEEGNMKKVDSSAKLIENPAGPDKTRKGEPQVVNFRTKNNAVTEYIEQETAKLYQRGLRCRCCIFGICKWKIQVHAFRCCGLGKRR